MSEGDEALDFRWEAFVPLLVHPMRVAILRVGRPLSANEVRKMCEEEHSVSYVSYHV